MDVGMLWFDNDIDSDLQASIERAATYYQGKYGQRPNLCFVDQSHLPGRKRKTVSNISVRTTKMQRNHFWIGMKNAKKMEQIIEPVS